MAKKILKVADKATLDEIKQILKFEEYVCNDVAISTSASLQPVLNITGKGNLHAVVCNGQSNANKGIFLKVTVDDTVIFNKGVYTSNNTTSSSNYINERLGILTPNFIPNTYNGTYFIHPLIPTTIKNIIVENDECVSGSSVLYSSNHSMVARIFSSHIKFDKSLKIEACCACNSGNVRYIYSLDD